MLADPNYNIFYNAGTLVVICAKPGGLNPAEDCCLAAQNLMLAAHAAGLGTCPIGFARPWLNLSETKKELALPGDFEAVCPLIVGSHETAACQGRRNGMETPELVIRFQRSATDLYQLTTARLLRERMEQKPFSILRSASSRIDFLIAAGEQMLEFLEKFHFTRNGKRGSSSGSISALHR
jgi:hypothetical protein